MESCREDSPFLDTKERSGDFVHDSGKVRIKRCEMCRHTCSSGAISIIVALNCCFLFLTSLGTMLLFFKGNEAFGMAECRNSDQLNNQFEFNRDISKVSSYSPIFNEVDLQPHPHRLNGRLHDNTSIYRRDPSPEVDQAWDRLSAEGFEIITVNKESMIRSGKSPQQSVKAPPSWGLGDEAYIAQVDAFHQIHCLNELRKEIYFSHYYGNDSRLNPDHLPKDHVEHKKHCIHILLQNIMCHADVDIITHNWVHYDDINQPNRPYAEPFADFNTVKECRNFEALLDWTQNNAVKDLGRKWRELEMPEDAEFVQGDGYF